MNVVVWIIQIALGLVMLMAGGMKLGGKEKLLDDPRMGWVEDYSNTVVRGVGVAEVLAGLALVLPWALDIAPVLTPLAGIGVALIQIGAIVTHSRRGETQMYAVNATLLVLGLVVAGVRFGDL